MNGMPKFMEGEIPHPDYYKKPDPYKNAPSCHVNLVALSRYARTSHKKLTDLTKEEMRRFII